jgi:hypothetical protein
MIGTFNAFQDPGVDGPHDFSDGQRTAIFRRQGSERSPGLCIVGPRPLRFETDQFVMAGVLFPLQEFRFTATELCQILVRKVDAALFGIGRQVAENVGELKGHSEIHRIVLCMGRSRTENVQTDQTDDRGDTVTIQR